MTINRIGILLLSLAVLFLGGCRTAEIRSIENAPTNVSAKVSTEKVGRAIIDAGTGLGWSMKAVRPGMIEGTLLIRSHMAKVEIPYNQHSYSILYKDSDNLRYDGTKIHSNYNSWVGNLDNAIRSRLLTL